MISLLAFLSTVCFSPLPPSGQSTSPTQSSAGEPQPVDAAIVLRKARNFWNRAQYPRYVSYTITVKSSISGRVLLQHYRALYSTETNVTRVNYTSFEESLHPVVPHGAALQVRFKISLGGSETIKKDVVSADTFPDYAGVPILSPIYNFGLSSVPRHSSDYSEPSDLKTIADVRSSNADYSVVMSGIEAVNGEEIYHLQLAPLRSPQQYRIRDLWVDAKTGATLKMTVATNFQAPKALNGPWTITYQTVGGLQYLSSERADGSINLNGRILNGIEINFDHVAENVSATDPVGFSFPELTPTNSLVEPPQ